VQYEHLAPTADARHYILQRRITDALCSQFENAVTETGTLAHILNFLTDWMGKYPDKAYDTRVLISRQENIDHRWIVTIHYDRKGPL